MTLIPLIAEMENEIIEANDSLNNPDDYAAHMNAAKAKATSALAEPELAEESPVAKDKTTTYHALMVASGDGAVTAVAIPDYAETANCCLTVKDNAQKAIDENT